MPIISLPDGHNAEFPDNMPMEEIKSVIQKKFPPTSKMEQSGNLERSSNFVEQNFNKTIKENLVDPALGAIQGISNIPSNAANLGIWAANKLPGVNIPKVPTFDVAPHTLQSDVGELGSFFAGGGILKALKSIPELAHTANASMKIPIIAHGFNAAKNLISKNPLTSKIIGNSLLGGVYSPDNPILGMSLGGSVPVIGKGIQKGLNGIKNIILENPKINNLLNKFMPESHAENIINKLGQGKSIDENSKSLINDIRNSYDARNEESSSFLNHALDRAGKEEIYEHVNPLISTALDKNSYILGKIKDLNVGDLYDTFKNKPSFINAHNLKSELGVMIGDLQKKPGKTIDEVNEIRKIKRVRDSLGKDIDTFLQKRDLNSNETLSPMYKKGIDLYRENVAPYLSNTKLRNIVRDRKEMVKNVHNIFDTPSDIIDKKTGELKIGPINKIIQDLPPESKNKIIYNAIGGVQNSANSLLKKLSKIENKGFSKYFSPELKEDINALNEKVYNKRNAKNIGKYSAGLLGAGVIANKLLPPISFDSSGN